MFKVDAVKAFSNGESSLIHLLLVLGDLDFQFLGFASYNNMFNIKRVKWKKNDVWRHFSFKHLIYM